MSQPDSTPRTTKIMPPKRDPRTGEPLTTGQPSAAPVALHVIPVPQGWSPEQAWEAISRGDLLTDPDPDWSIIRTESGRMVELVEVESDAD